MASPTPRKRTRQAKIELYRELILDAAERVFADRGYEGTKVNDIAREAGLSLGTLYGVFGGKGEVHQALHERRLDTLLALTRLPRVAAECTLIPILAGVRVYVEFHAEHPDYLRMHLREGNAWTSEETLRHGVEVRAWRDGLERMVAYIEEGQQAGHIVAGEPALLAKMMVATHQVILADWVERDATDPVEDVVQRAQTVSLRVLATPAGVAEART